ncbi:hypothetical protein MBT84_47985 [Streptomyces sp. MBT84]|nr:hypothetical protein [Streptomyces sp. MBT84]
MQAIVHIVRRDRQPITGAASMGRWAERPRRLVTWFALRGLLEMRAVHRRAALPDVASRFSAGQVPWPRLLLKEFTP